jgi:hypothetical protein
VLRWHRDLLARRHAAWSRPKRPGRPRTVRSIRALVLRLARENPGWGYRRIHGELLVPGIKTAASTVWEILKEAGIDPAPERSSTTWADFLRSQADALLACDFFETTTLTGARMHVLAVLEHASRRIRILGATAHPTASWVTQAAKNLVVDHRGCRLPCAVPDPGPRWKVPRPVRRGPQGPRNRARAQRRPDPAHERAHGTLGADLQTRALDRTVIWNQRHLLHALREFEQFYNSHRPHQGIANARPLHALPSPIYEPDTIARLDIRRRDRLGGILHEHRHAA